jgi:O-antigen ligase
MNNFSNIFQSNKRLYICLFALTALFIAANMFAIYNGSWLLSIASCALFLLFFALFNLDTLLIIIMFFVPVSVELSVFYPQPPINMNLPTEPLLFLTMCIFFIKLLVEKRFDKEVLKHPVSIAIYAYLVWLLFSCITSVDVVVSFKSLLMRLWFIVSFYFLMTQLIATDKKNITICIIAYSLGMLIAIAYTTYNHALADFSHQSSYRAMFPIFRDHTSYGAALAMLLPAVFACMRLSHNNLNIKVLYAILLFILCIALILSYSRAAWLGVAFAIGVLVLVKLKISFRTLCIIVGFMAVIIIPMRNEIYFALQKNDTDSSVDMMEHIKSASNISTDESNVERINRWKAALRMFQTEPIVGFGLGTYAFSYAPFQISSDLSNASTNAGNRGNAHSEYLGLLAETGCMGLLCYLAIIITTIAAAVRVFKRSNSAFARQMALFLVLALSTYYLHGFLNNFLDMDKIASLFWSFMAIIVVLDIETKKATNQLTDELTN